MDQSELKMHHARLAALCAAVPGPDEVALATTRTYLDTLIKPHHSLGQIETLLLRLAASTGKAAPTLERRAILIAAADHGVAVEGVSTYTEATTAQMTLNCITGGTAINVLAAAAGARIVLVDAGVAGDIPPSLSLRQLNLRKGCGNIAREPAMSRAEALIALLAGATIVQEEFNNGLDLLALGEVGVGHTTAAAALTSVCTGTAPDQTVEHKLASDELDLEHKRHIVATALQRYRDRNRVDHDAHRAAQAAGLSEMQDHAMDLLCELGGLDIAVLVGAILAATAHRVPVMLDDYTTTSAALVAQALAPNLRTHLFAAHRSPEPGHTVGLAHLGLTAEDQAGPLLQLDLQFGEGSGATLAMPVLTSATRLMSEMAVCEPVGLARRK